jgi:pimeloyl-ACP methyl ester carboxylesterase
MADFVLVHGAWCGAWCWDRLAGELREAGHRVVVADLTGLGNREAALHPGITLTTHVDDVVDQIADAGFDRFVLVGHSYGGMVVTGVATRLGSRIDTLIYVDAFVPQDGQSLWDMTGDFEHDFYIDSQKFTPGAVAPLPGLEMPLLTPHPLLTLVEAVRFTGEEAKVGRRIYIFASGWEPTPFRQFRDRVASDSGWQLHEWPSSHAVMADQPELLHDVLIGSAN